MPIEANFFPYMQQLPGGDIAAMVGRDLFNWARSHVDELAFSGKSHPACHARLSLNGKLLTLFSIRAYPKTPSLQLHFKRIAAHPPYQSKRSRRALLKRLNLLLPKQARLPANAIDRRPTFALQHLESAAVRQAFYAIAQEICDRLNKS